MISRTIAAAVLTTALMTGVGSAQTTTADKADRATMHRAHGDYDRSQSRVLWRIIVEGDRPVLV